MSLPDVAMPSLPTLTDPASAAAFLQVALRGSDPKLAGLEITELHTHRDALPGGTALHHQLPDLLRGRGSERGLARTM